MSEAYEGGDANVIEKAAEHIHAALAILDSRPDLEAACRCAIYMSQGLACLGKKELSTFDDELASWATSPSILPL